MNKHGGIEIQLYDNTIYFKEMNRGVTMAQKTPEAQENTMAQKSYNHEYIVGNSFRMELETVLTNCPECVKSDYKSWGGRIENSFNKLAAGI